MPPVPRRKFTRGSVPFCFFFAPSGGGVFWLSRGGALFYGGRRNDNEDEAEISGFPERAACGVYSAARCWKDWCRAAVVDGCIYLGIAVFFCDALGGLGMLSYWFLGFGGVMVARENKWTRVDREIRFFVVFRGEIQKCGLGKVLAREVTAV